MSIDLAAKRFAQGIPRVSVIPFPSMVPGQPIPTIFFISHGCYIAPSSSSSFLKGFYLFARARSGGGRESTHAHAFRSEGEREKLVP